MSDAEQRLDEIRARCEAATPGPWPLPDERVSPLSVGGYVRDKNYDDRLPVDHEGCDVWPWHEEADMVFAYRAREDIPFLLELLDAERARVDRLKRDLVDEWQCNHAERCANMDPFHDRGGTCYCELPESVTRAEARAILSEREAR